MSKTRFGFATLSLVNSAITVGTKNLPTVVKRHTSAVNNKRFAEGANYEAAKANTGNEFAMLVRPEKDGNFNLDFSLKAETVGTQAATKNGGKERYPAATVKMDRNGNVTEVVKLHTSPLNALRFAEGANDESKSDGSGVEYAIVLRTATRGGSFPTISSK